MDSDISKLEETDSAPPPEASLPSPREIPQNLIDENLTAEKYYDLHLRLERIGTLIIDEYVEIEGVKNNLASTAQTLSHLGEFVNKKIPFSNHGTGISTLDDQASLLLDSFGDSSDLKSNTDCKLPIIALGYAISELNKRLGVVRKIYFGLGTPVHPHVITETENELGEITFLDLDFNNVSPNKIKPEVPMVNNSETKREIAKVLVESPDDTHQVTFRKRPLRSDFDRREARENTGSYLHVRPLERDQLKNRLDNERFANFYYSNFNNINFLRLLDTNFLKQN